MITISLMSNTEFYELYKKLLANPAITQEELFDLGYQHADVFAAYKIRKYSTAQQVPAERVIASWKGIELVVRITG